MNDLEYLNQISAKPAPVQPTLFDKKTKLILIIAAAVLLLVVILMAVAGSSSSEPTASSELARLYHRSDALEQSLTTYTPSVKSSSLRSSAATLSTILAELKSTSNTYFTASGAKLEDYPLAASDSKIITALDSSLENARLNGILDRTFASEIYYQIRYLIIIEDSTLAKSSDASLTTFLQSSKTSLERLRDTFATFSESE